ncbi:hypothetical protein SDRG_13783 [Saprolegnia diclina VS20]|uniref:PDZ domain-containing protein n=1 Tax=Saprolegnia diclina (strain VS20) TaxID=1156394 RepID=T0Q4Z1_SAPDV|nr:hypothetical protein SDRG_13783 [Saprolegnia diclina VS20]EQC28455.1 hypothetical protein SDRG_13783 [Saprolegnia diclina VS20]|eukprot:XP_008618103.1 hypothetical protein SDRG_13783 [Saprolegnia diclina VS20]
MVAVQISKNNGFFEYKEVDVDVVSGLRCIGDMKLLMANAIYAEEDLFTLEGPHEVKLYHMPGADDVDSLADTDMVTILEWVNGGDAPSQWVLDIFGRPLVTSISTDLVLDDIDNLRISYTSASSPLRPASPGATSGYEPFLHVGTWVPMLSGARAVRRDSGPGSSNLMGLVGRPTPQLQSEYEDIVQTTHRAQETLRKFQSIGKPVTTQSLQTILLPLAMASPSAIARYGPSVLHQGVYTLIESDLQKGFVQAVRIWFRFDNERTLKVTKRNGSLGLKPVRQQDGWIVVQAVPGSACALAGMPPQEVFLTHVNGVDVSPPTCPAISDKTTRPQNLSHSVSWAGNVVPLVEETDVCELTYF